MGEGKGRAILIIETKKYFRSFKKLPQHIQSLARSKIDLFMHYPNHVGLHVHKLHGSYNEEWSFRINFEIRVIFRWDGNNAMLFDIGTHDIYD